MATTPIFFICYIVCDLYFNYFIALKQSELISNGCSRLCHSELEWYFSSLAWVLGER